jgi:hypothetical protein
MSALCQERTRALQQCRALFSAGAVKVRAGCAACLIVAPMGSQFGHDIDFSCPHCGARYAVSYIELPIADSGSDYCECCKRRMLQWNSALQPRYRLVERPERKHP